MLGIDFHEVRTRVVVGVIVTLILVTLGALFETVRSSVSDFLDPVWAGLQGGWNLLIASCTTPGWLLLLLVALSCIAVVWIVWMAWPRSRSDLLDYTEDTIYDCEWRWEWRTDREGKYYPKEPVPFCLTCSREVVVQTVPHIKKTRLICEHCDTQVGTVPWSTTFQVRDGIQREVRGRVDSDEYRQRIADE